VKDNWDDEDPEPVSDPKSEPKDPSTKVKTGPKVKSAKEKRDEKKRLEDEERARIAALKNPKSADELLAEKRAIEDKLKADDLSLFVDSLGIDQRTTSPGAVVNFEDVVLKSREDFESFTKSLVVKMSSEQKSPFYVPFLENLFRDLCVTLDQDDVKRLSASLNALFNEKVKASKGDKKPKKAKGIKVNIEKKGKDAFDLDGSAQGGADDYDDDDFM